MLKEWLKGETCMKIVVVFLYVSFSLVNEGMRTRKKEGRRKKKEVEEEQLEVLGSSTKETESKQ